MVGKLQRIRDPIHNLIEFKTEQQFDRVMWDVINSRPFQRLRRIKQLGFSELVFPGATHSRFAHSLGVFHTARTLIEIIKRDVGQRENRSADVALGAALVHDLGHGMFSHAFEDVGKRLGLPMAMHEIVSDALIRDSEISEALSPLGRSFPEEVADVISNKNPLNIFDSIVSSQFDADRLDYMQRDRLMTGVQGSGVDATWLLANLQVGIVSLDADEQSAGSIETLVLGRKAFHAAEHYVLSLFQLYPNVYLHKTTRGAEKIFSALIMRLAQLIRDGNGNLCGILPNHPIYKFLLEPNLLDNALNLDDSILFGAIPSLCDARDITVSEYAKRIHERKLLKCIDIRNSIENKNPLKKGSTHEDRREREANISIKIKNITQKIKEYSLSENNDTHMFIDEYKRSPYKKFQDSQSPLNQILIHGSSGIEDMAHISAVVSGAESYEINRVYVRAEDAKTISSIQSLLNG